MTSVWRAILFALLLLPAGCCTTATGPIPDSPLLAPVPIDRPVTAAPKPPDPSAPSTVRTVLDPEAPPRYLSLSECVALALENGRVNGENIRVLAYDPAVAAAEIEQSLSRFDARWQSGIKWEHADRPLGTAQQSLFSNASFEDADKAQFDSRLEKPLPAGGLAGITYTHVYQLTNLPANVNPSHEPTLSFTFDQPLLQGYGIEINQLRSSHPTSQGGRGGGQGILLARVAFDQSRAEFERRVQELVAGVEEAYWNLYCSYWILYSREIALRQVYHEWLSASYRLKEKRFTVQGMDQIEEQYHQYRAERLTALGNGAGQPGVLEAERLLRLAIGLPPEDGCRLVPSDTPTVAPFHPDWQVAADQALALRPELVRAREEVKSAQLTLMREQNDLLPDLKFTSSYDITALGSRLDGSEPQNAWRNLAGNTFNNWSLGLRLDVPLGRRDARATVRRAQLQLGQRLASLRNQEEQIVFDLQRAYRQLSQSAEQIRIQRARRAAAARQLQAQLLVFQAGLAPPGTEGPVVLVVLTAQRNLADALRDEQVAICEYNIALAQFERQKGTILVHDNVDIVEGPLPTCVHQRASENLRKQQSALVLRKRAEAPSSDAAPLMHAVSDEPVPLPVLLEQPTAPAELPPRPTTPEVPPTPPPPPGPPR